MNLLTRLRQAGGPDRELDAEIGRHFGWRVVLDNFKRPRWRGVPPGRFDRSRVRLPAWTSSLDAALSLCEQMLSGSIVGIENIAAGFVCEARIITEASGGEVITQYEGEAPTAPLAVLCALISAWRRGVTVMEMAPREDAEADTTELFRKAAETVRPLVERSLRNERPKDWQS